MSVYGILADLLVAIHVGYVGYVAIGQLFILAGWMCGWRWTRNRWFRISHLIAIAVVAFEAIAGLRCPLTVWEEQLREAAGQSVKGDQFIGRLLHALIFYDFEPWVFDAIHIGFGALVLLTFICYPPRFRKQRPTDSIIPETRAVT